MGKVKKLLTTKGFTLIEMMIALSVMAIIIVVTYPNMTDAKRDSILKYEAQSVMSEIKYIQQLSVDEGVAYRLYFDSEGTKCFVRRASGGANIREHNFNSTIFFDDIKSSGLMLLNGESFLEVVGEKGIIDGTTQTVVALKNVVGTNIYVKILQGRKIEISWN